ncbi:hypothetical protein H2248_004620 [Termitomyces sp. 'cryptogamus']|nr:hypothetical protein H2248_004620 [Termitomyces sp. 'cryptogamus']
MSSTKPVLPPRSAWARGPPQSTSRAQSPAPAHSRRPSTGVPIKDGVSVSRGTVAAIKAGKLCAPPAPSVSFGSIDDDAAPISSSPAAAPVLKAEGVTSFGSLAAAPPNGSKPARVPSTTAKPASADIKKLFQTAPADASPRPAPPPLPYQPFVPAAVRPPPAPTRPPPAPAYPRPNGNPPRPPSQGLPSPRMAPNPMPVPGWPGYYVRPANENIPLLIPVQYPPEQQQFLYGWYPPPGPPPPHNPIPQPPQPVTPTQAHAVPPAFASPPPTPSTATTRLSAASSAFVPSNRSSKIVLKHPDGLEVDINSIASPSPGPRAAFRQSTPASPAPTPRRPTSVRLETEEQRLKRLADEERKKEEEERIKKAEQDRIKKEEEERVKKEEEERRQAEEERIKKEEEERMKKEEEERIKREEEERERIKEETRAKEEADRKAREEEERRQAEERLREEEAAKAKAEAEDGQVTETPLRISTTDLPKKPRPGALNLTDATTETLPPSLPSALSLAKSITNFNEISYPAGIQSPDPTDGLLRYDRSFLLQFMEVCKEKPDGLPDLVIMGLEPNTSAPENFSMSRGGSGRHKNSSANVPSRQGSLGLGISGFKASTFPSMGNFGSGPSKLTTSDERFAASNRAVSASAASAYGGRPSPMTRTSSQGGVGGTPMGSNRTRSKRGEKRGESNKVGYGHGASSSSSVPPSELVAPLEVSANRWDRRAIGTNDDKVALVDRKVKALLNKLTMEKFDSISDQIVEWANRSEEESEGKTLMQVIGLVFEKATDEATWSEMYAKLCRKMMERLSPTVRDESIKLQDGKPIAGGQLFRKYLLNRCQDEFEHGWAVKEATAAAAAKKAAEDQAVKAANEKEGNTEVALYSDEYYAAQKAKRRGLGLIKFIGELFKLQMLTERIMHTCLKKLLGNVDQPEEEDLESCCKLLMTIGSMLDSPKAANHMTAYFMRITELRNSPNVSSRVQFMLQDVLELREKKWVSRNTVAAPTTIAQVHENAAKEKAAQEKDAYTRQISMSRGGSRRGGNRDDYTQVGPDGWAVAGSGNAPRGPPKAGDLSNFGKINKTTSSMSFGPSTVFAKKGGDGSKRESVSRSSSNSNMFSMLSQGDASPVEVKAPEPQRKRLVLAPRTKPTADEVATKSESEAESEGEEVSSSSVEMTEEQATKKIDEDLKEFFAVRNLDEAEVYLTSLSAPHHFRLVDKFTSRAVESKEAEAQLLAELFARAVEKELVSAEAFEAGFMPIAEIIDDIAIDAPKAFVYFAMVVKSAGLDEERKSRLASKSLDEGKLLGLLAV